MSNGQAAPRAAGGLFALNAKTGFRGVYNYKDKFKALLRYKSQAYSCGYHDNAEDAARAFDVQARQLGVGEEELNFPNDNTPPPPAPLREPGTLFSVNSGTGFRGVYSCGKGKYQAQFQYRGTTYNAGRHDSAEHAARAFDAQARKLGIDECELNFPGDLTPVEPPAAPPNPLKPPGALFGINAQTGFRGVYNSDRGDKFIALIRYEGQKFNCGRYRTAEAAARAFDAQARELRIAEEHLNFPYDLTPPEVSPPKAIGTLFCVNAVTGFRGVSSSDGEKFKARVCYKGEAYNCGTHASALMAARAFDMKARELGIDEAELNFPNDLTPPDAPPAKPPGSLFEVNATAGYRGVYNYKDKFQSRVCYAGVKYSCGTHETAEAAARAFDAKARELGVAEEELNFPNDTRPPAPPAPRPAGSLFSVNGETGYRGVYYHKDKYQSRVCYEGTAYNCGTHLSADAAAHAFDKQARELGVPEEELNFPFKKPRPSLRAGLLSLASVAAAHAGRAGGGAGAAPAGGGGGGRAAGARAQAQARAQAAQAAAAAAQAAAAQATAAAAVATAAAGGPSTWPPALSWTGPAAWGGWAAPGPSAWVAPPAAFAAMDPATWVSAASAALGSSLGAGLAGAHYAPPGALYPAAFPPAAFGPAFPGFGPQAGAAAEFGGEGLPGLAPPPPASGFGATLLIPKHRKRKELAEAAEAGAGAGAAEAAEGAGGAC